MIKLSVVIITFNEEKNIARCLDSVKTIADEIVVLDSFSKDKTEEICKTYGVQFFQHAFDGHIQQKNRAITYATSPFILSLDADEALDETLIRSVIEAKKSWKFDGYSMNRLNYYCGKWLKHGGWYPDKKLRLWDSRKGEWGGVNPHDKYELFDKAAPTGHLKGNILHYSYYAVEEHYKQAEYFTTIAANALFKSGKKAGFVKTWISPAVRFIRDYIVKLGFLDGRYGYIACKIMAYSTYLKYKKLNQLHRKSE
jgi:glycosyltransferase involved in cell wall biosynthesis